MATFTPSEEDPDLLLAKALAGTLHPEEAALLETLCRQDPSLLDRLAQQTLTHRLLHNVLRDPKGTTFAAEILLRLAENAPPAAQEPQALANKVTSLLKFRRLRRRLLQCAAALVLAAVLGWTLHDASAAARIVQTEGLGEDPAWQTGRRFRSGEHVVLHSGVVALRFRSGAEVLMEGPAELKIKDAWHSVLKRGRLVAHVGPKSHGFTVDGPGGRLVDRGTRFAVAAEEGRGMELHVLEGLVEATPEGQKDTLQIQQNQAIRLRSGRSERMNEADGRAFVTALPNRKQGAAPGFVHWNFDQEALQMANHGRGLADSAAGLQIHPAPALPSSPLHTPGPFGKALSFAGDGTFAESPFRGIGGSDPRTVAFWVKIPKDFRPKEGYAIVSWGSRMQAGAAWQISINPEANEGPIGRLRVGVNLGPVVGTTDLRDDQWHHCAVVLYGGQNADISTHVLLYVDGQLEPAARKAVMPVFTDTQSLQAHGIWLGRNLGHSDTPGRSGFRGELDELYIFDAALAQEDLLHLMRQNTPRPQKL
jgi:hypothetical protein